MSKRIKWIKENPVEAEELLKQYEQDFETLAKRIDNLKKCHRQISAALNKSQVDFHNYKREAESRIEELDKHNRYFRQRVFELRRNSGLEVYAENIQLRKELDQALQRGELMG